jgi:hypothetical protein
MPNFVPAAHDSGNVKLGNSPAKLRSNDVSDYYHRIDIPMTANFHPPSHWTDMPVLRVSSGSETDEYRLNEGRVEFRRVRGRHWRQLAYTDLQQHFALQSPVGTWLANLYSTAKLGKVLCR